MPKFLARKSDGHSIKKGVALKRVHKLCWVSHEELFRNSSGCLFHFRFIFLC
jgi:hypothetical protein